MISEGLGKALRLLKERSAKKTEGWRKKSFPSALMNKLDSNVTTVFLGGHEPLARYKLLFNYFLAGFLEFRTEEGERVYYPGFKGKRGHRIEGLEGFARTGPLIASWLASGRPPIVQDPRGGGHLIDLPKLLQDGILVGTDPGSPNYWGDLKDRDQRIVEAADIALILWLTRDVIWTRLSPSERVRVTAWLNQVKGRQVPTNNWMLFQVLVLEVLQALGAVASTQVSRNNYEQFKSLYRGAGWFEDPPKGIDFYNAWGIGYSLYWIDQINPKIDRQFIREVLKQSADLTLHLISPEGLPLMGRSVCYRMAVPCPVLIMSLLDSGGITPGQAQRALDAVWRYFIAHGSLAQGAATQGYHGPDKRLLDHYSGTGSCQWALRSLVLALCHSDKSAFWNDASELLPIEQGSYRLELPELGWIVEGHAAEGTVSIIIPANEDRPRPLIGHNWWRQALETIFQRPLQSQNVEAKYQRRRYSSDCPLDGAKAEQWHWR